MLVGLSAVLVLMQVPNSAASEYQPRYIPGTVYQKGFSASDVGFTEQSLARFKDQSWDWALSEGAAYVPTTVDSLAKKLRVASDGLLPSGATKDARLFAMSYITGVWVKTHMRYLDAGPGVSHTGTDSDGRTVSFEKRSAWVNTRDFLRCTTLVGACRHSAVIVRDLITAGARDLGGSVHYVGGWSKSEARGTGHRESNHAWNLVKLPNGLWIPFDATGTATTLEQWRQQHQRFYPCPCAVDFPKSAADFEVFFAKHYGTTLDHYATTDANGVARSSALPRGFVHQDFFMSWKLDDWLAKDTTDVRTLRQRVMASYLRR